MTGAEPAKLVAVDIRLYKNIRNLHLDWADRVTLFGPNGAGKTNILEAIALAIGTDATLWQLAGRADAVEPGAISLSVRQVSHSIWFPPNLLYEGFWSDLGADKAATTWAEGIASCALPPLVTSLLLEAGLNPTIRYALESISGLEDAAFEQRGVGSGPDVAKWPGYGVNFLRTFRRYLCVNKRDVKKLAKLRQNLPGPFQPLNDWFDRPQESRSPYMDLVELPPLDRAPLDAIWLAGPRTTNEAIFDLQKVHDETWPFVAGLMHAVSPLLDIAPEETANTNITAQWLTSAIAAEAASERLHVTMPDFSWYTEDDLPSALALYRDGENKPTRELWADFSLEKLSAGERVWADYALAHGAAAMTCIAKRLRTLPVLLDLLSAEERAEVKAELTRFRQALRYVLWGFSDDLYAITGAIERAVSRSAHPELAFLDQQAAVTLAPGSNALCPPICLYDEPERHLHLLLQRSVAAALSAPTSEGVAIATHSPVFLGRTGWKHYQVLAKGPDGHPEVKGFSPAAMTAHHELARAVGLTRGELLASVRFVLVVEGQADVEVLRVLFGDLLDSAGVLVLPMRGIDEAASLAELEILGVYIDVPIGVLADHARVERLDRRWKGPLTKEERALRDLQKRLGDAVEVHGIPEEDIVACLDERGLQAVVPEFPGWDAVTNQRRRSESLKQAIERLSGGRTVNVDLIRSAALVMREREYPASASLQRVVADVVARARKADTR